MKSGFVHCKPLWCQFVTFSSTLNRQCRRRLPGTSPKHFKGFEIPSIDHTNWLARALSMFRANHCVDRSQVYSTITSGTLKNKKKHCIFQSVCLRVYTEAPSHRLSERRASTVQLATTSSHSCSLPVQDANPNWNRPQELSCAIVTEILVRPQILSRHKTMFFLGGYWHPIFIDTRAVLRKYPT